MAALPRVVVITDWGLPDLVERLRAVAAAHGPQVAIQHRAPGMVLRDYLARARQLATLSHTHGTPLFVNARLDVALLCGAHLHLPGEAPWPSEVRPLLPAHRWISQAVHGADEAPRTHEADLALVSPVFAPGSKPGDTRPTLGAEGFTRLAQALPCPAYALGGISPSSAVTLRGAYGVAAISGVLAAPDPVEACRALLDALR